jgi:hypothetical protein
MGRNRVVKIVELLLLLAAVGVAYVGQIRGQESLYWLAAGLVSALIAAHLQQRGLMDRGSAPTPERVATDARQLPTSQQAHPRRTKPKKPTKWQKKGAFVCMALVVALGVVGLVGADVGVVWDPLVQASQNQAVALNMFAIGPAVFCTLGGAVVVSAGLAGAVPPVAGGTVTIVARLAGFVVGGGATFFAIPAGVNILGHWMSPLAAIWTSVMGISAVVTIAWGWFEEAGGFEAPGSEQRKPKRGAIAIATLSAAVMLVVATATGQLIAYFSINPDPFSAKAGDCIWADQNAVTQGQFADSARRVGCSSFLANYKVVATTIKEDNWFCDGVPGFKFDPGVVIHDFNTKLDRELCVMPK